MAPNAKKPAVAPLIIKSGSNNLGYGRFQARSARYPYPAKDKNANGRIPMQNLIFLPASKQMVNCTIAGTRIKSGKKSISSRNIQTPLLHFFTTKWAFHENHLYQFNDSR